MFKGEKNRGGASQTSLEQMLVAFALYMPTAIQTRVPNFCTDCQQGLTAQATGCDHSRLYLSLLVAAQPLQETVSSLEPTIYRVYVWLV